MRQTKLEKEQYLKKLNYYANYVSDTHFLNMNELADRSQLKVEDVYKIIKDHDLSYHWKFQK